MSELTPFRVLAVCTGNISRSPVVERLLALRLGPTVSVRSAGTAALVGEPIDPPMAVLLAEVGGDPGGFEARQVTERLLTEADLILTLTRDQRSRVVELAPATVRRSYTLLEFARLVRAVDPVAVPARLVPGERLRALVPLAASLRPAVRKAAHETDDVPDPYRRGQDAYDLAMELILEATGTISRVARG